jgi:hypothetical protein
VKIKYRILLIIGLLLFFMITVPAFVFVFRAPALIITDTSFAALYGTSRIRRRQAVVSLALFRRVKPVTVADGVGSDVLMFAIEEVASRPYCVLFPYRYSEAAKRYREQAPEIPVVLMEGRINGPGQAVGAEGVLTFRTDRETDYYRAGLCAGSIGVSRQKAENMGEAGVERSGKTGPENPEPGRVAFLYDRFSRIEERDLFARGLREAGLETAPLFVNSANQIADTRDIACVVLAGSGAEYLDRNLKIPVILFSWLDPALTPRETVLIFDDSAWALAVPAVRMAVKEGQFGEKIPSKVLIFSARIADNRVFRKLKKLAGERL